MIRPTALAAAIAASLLAVSGAGGAPAQTPKRGGTLVIGTLTQGEPSCLNVLLRCNVPWLVEQVLPGAFKIWPDATMRPNLVSDAEIVRKQPVTIVYRIRQEARWSDGVPVTARDFEFTHRVRLEHPRVNEWHLNVRRVRAVGAKTVEVVLRTRWVDWRLLFDVVLPRHVAAGQDFESLWKDGSTTRGRGGRSAAGHSSSRAGSAAGS